jgi:hypothetical protein
MQWMCLFTFTLVQHGCCLHDGKAHRSFRSAYFFAHLLSRSLLKIRVCKGMWILNYVERKRCSVTTCDFRFSRRRLIMETVSTPLKRRSISIRLHGTTSQKTVTFCHYVPAGLHCSNTHLECGKRLLAEEWRHIFAVISTRRKSSSRSVIKPCDVKRSCAHRNSSLKSWVAR